MAQSLAIPTPLMPPPMTATSNTLSGKELMSLRLDDPYVKITELLRIDRGRRFGH